MDTIQFQFKFDSSLPSLPPDVEKTLRVQDITYVIGLSLEDALCIYEELSQTREATARYRDNAMRALEIITVTRNFTEIPNITTAREGSLRNDVLPVAGSQPGSINQVEPAA